MCHLNFKCHANLLYREFSIVSVIHAWSKKETEVSDRKVLNSALLLALVKNFFHNCIMPEK